MNVLKDMEAWFVLLFGLIIACAYLHDVTPAPPAPARQAEATPAAPMPVVIITAKRPGSEQKRAGN